MTMSNITRSMHALVIPTAEISGSLIFCFCWGSCSGCFFFQLMEFSFSLSSLLVCIPAAGRYRKIFCPAVCLDMTGSFISCSGCRRSRFHSGGVRKLGLDVCRISRSLKISLYIEPSNSEHVQPFQLDSPGNPSCLVGAWLSLFSVSVR